MSEILTKTLPRLLRVAFIFALLTVDYKINMDHQLLNESVWHKYG